MPKAKIAVTLDEDVLQRLDDLVRRGAFRSRSGAVEEAVQEMLERLARTRLARECAKLDRDAERALADEGLSADVSEWPRY